MKLFKNLRIIILIVCIVLAIAAINPTGLLHSGATIRNVEKESAASVAGIVPSDPKITPVMRERITSINGMPIASQADYETITSTFKPNLTITIETNSQAYTLKTRPLLNITYLPQMETVNITEEIFNSTSDTFENITHLVTRNKTKSTIIGTEPLGITVYDSPKTNIRFGLDLSGGARVLLQPEHAVTQDQLDQIIDTIKQRLNVFGLSDIVVRSVSDLSGNQFILVEIAGASEKDVRELILQQGKFEAKVGNESIFKGGSDITYVCRSPDCSGISPKGCQQTSSGYACEFQFQITMTADAANRQANITKNLAVITRPDGQQYLEKPLDLYLDDQKVDTLQISAGLKGSAVTRISITGSGTGSTQRAAAEDTINNMKKLQTILVTGSLPVKLVVVKTDSISAELGDEFIRNALFVGLIALIAVTTVIVIRYRDLKVSIPVMITLISEIIIIVGAAALIGWNLDLASIAGILIAIGTGVDAQIVIADEVLGRKKHETEENWKEKIKKAFFIIFTSYFTALAAMVPLWWAGAGLVRGFAITTIIGISIGTFITRPAFAVIMEKLEHKED